MALERSFFLDIVKDAFSAFYTIFPPDETELPLAFRADYVARDETYFLVKSAQIWTNEKNEYAYVFSAPRFDAALAEKCMGWALEDMLPKVKPHKEHQYTNCKVVLIADSLDESVISAVQKKKFSKSYGPFSLHGYTELLTAAVDLQREKTYSNRAGQGLDKFFGKLFALRHEEA